MELPPLEEIRMHPMHEGSRRASGGRSVISIAGAQRSEDFSTVDELTRRQLEDTIPIVSTGHRCSRIQRPGSDGSLNSHGAGLTACSRSPGNSASINCDRIHPEEDRRCRKCSAHEPATRGRRRTVALIRESHRDAQAAVAVCRHKDRFDSSRNLARPSSSHSSPRTSRRIERAVLMIESCDGS